MIYLFLADGFEDTEAIAALDVLRRAGLDAKTVGVTGNTVKSSHGVTVATDISAEEAVMDESVDAIILPGGIPGTPNLENSDVVQDAITYCAEHDKYLCAICAAPSILGHRGILEGKRAICYPGWEKDLTGAVVTKQPVVIDGKVITSNGAGSALLFGEAIAAQFVGAEAAHEVLLTMQYSF